MKKYNVIVDNDSSAGFEFVSFRHKLFNIFVLPILHRLPKKFQKLIKKSNKQAAEVIDNATTHKALEVLYHKGESKHKKSYIQKLFKKIWFSLLNSKAVRNRLRIVKRELDQAIEKIKQQKKEIRILSIAAGSARAVIESVEIHEGSGSLFHLTFLDKNEKAIEYSKNLSEEKLSQAVVVCINDTVGNFLKNNEDKKYDIIEMVGLIDYFDDDKVKTIFTKLHQLLDKDGLFITANVNHNKERKFLEKMIDWHMVYRSAEELAFLLEDSQFKEEKMTIYYEPLKIHSVIIARK